MRVDKKLQLLKFPQSTWRSREVDIVNKTSEEDKKYLLDSCVIRG